MNAVFADFLERAGWTAGQQFVAVLLAGASGASLVGLPWKLALVTSVGAGIVSLLATGLQYLTKQTSLRFWPDLLVRLGKTFISSLLGSIGAEVFDVLAFDWVTALNVAAVATIVAFAKGLLARGAPATRDAGTEPPRAGNPSTLPVDTYVAAVTR